MYVPPHSSDLSWGPRNPPTSRVPATWLHSLRLGTAGVGLVLLLLAVESGAEPARLPYAVLLGASALSLGYAVISRRLGDRPQYTALQIAIDVFLVTALVYLTGGVYSFATILYFGAVLAAGLCVSRGLSFLVASTCTVALAGIQILYAMATADPPLLDLPLVGQDFLATHRLRFGRETAYLLAQGIGLHTVAALGSYLRRELQHVRILYGEILEHMAEGLVVIDRRGRLVFVNGEARRLLGYAKADALEGRDFRDVFRRRQDHDLLACLLSDQPVAVEVEVSTRGGTRAFHVKTTVLTDERGAKRGTIGVFTDLTLQRQAEEAARRAERLEQLKTLSVGIAHEVRNPLASIRGCVQELARHAFLGEDEQQLVRIVCRESDRLDAIVGDFMQFAKMRAPMPAPCDLARLLGDTAILLRNREGAAAARVEVDLPEAAPLVADAAQLQQVFMNLGLNALEAMGWRGRLRIALGRARVGVSALVSAAHGLGRTYTEVDGYEVVFADEGPGIPEDAVAQIFVPFFTTKASGTGLGLPVADRIVKAHGGEIVVANAPGGGARFAVRLPERWVREADEAGREAPGPASSAARRGLEAAPGGDDPPRDAAERGPAQAQAEAQSAPRALAGATAET